MTKLWPFFCFYGGKWRAAPRYPKPLHKTIVGSFAGAAGYETRYADHDVILVETDPVIAALWRWLIATTPSDILSLPAEIPDGTIVTTLDIPKEAQALIGFWCNKGTSAPSLQPSKWMRDRWRPKSFWGIEIRERIAKQVQAIKHWQLIEGDYTNAPNIVATWFIDPPYSGAAGRLYKYNKIDYTALGAWCRTREGQVMVCENVGATWLPFKPYITIKGLEGAHGKKQSQEAIWTNDNACRLVASSRRSEVLPQLQGSAHRCLGCKEAAVALLSRHDEVIRALDVLIEEEE